MAQKHSHYEVLQVSRSASPEQIAEAYRRLAKQYHPDWNPDDPTASEQFKGVTKAYDVLSNPKRRAKYDENLARRARAANTAPAPPPVQEENTSRTDSPHAEPHVQAAPHPEGNATHQTEAERFPFTLVVFILAVVAIPASYFAMTYQTPDSEVRSLLDRAEIKIQLGDLDEATHLVRKATNIEGANNLTAAKKLLDVIAGQQDTANHSQEAPAEAISQEPGTQVKVNDSERTTKVTHYVTGQIKSEFHYKYGKQEGLQTYWYENGVKKQEFHYKYGKLEGLQNYWYENGQKESEAHWKHGAQDGLETWWDEDGNKTQEMKYKDGKAMWRKKF